MKNIKTFMAIVVLALLLTSCGKKSDNKENKTQTGKTKTEDSIIIEKNLDKTNENKTELSYKNILINKESFDSYPAVLLKFSNEKIIKIWKDFTEEGLEEIDFDLWIEPRDPEITGLSKNVFLKVVDEKFDSIDFNYINDLQIYESKLEKNDIVKWTVFIINSNDNLLFKVEIVDFDKVEELIELKYQKIN